MRLAIFTLITCFHALAKADGGGERITPLGTQSLLETSGGLLLILLLIFGGAWLFRRYAHPTMAGKNPIHILGGVSVGPRERVILLQVEDTRLLIGVAPGQVRTLHQLGHEAPADNGFQAQLNTSLHEDAKA